VLRAYNSGVAPDRRFGLPHPLDDEPGEGDSRRKSGLWHSLKRAIAGGAMPAEESAAPADRSAIPLPGVGPRTTDDPVADGPLARPDPSPPVVPPPPLGALGGVGKVAVPPAAQVPFLADTVEPASTEAPRPEGTARPAAPAKIAESKPPDPAPPRLARGLASFSRDNARREKRFSHLLRDSPRSKPAKPSSKGRK
jgi:hypothetical protein